MDVFEFILVLMTVIVSLGIAELLGGVVRVLQHELKPGHLHWLWVLLIFNMQIQWLWFSWNFRDRGSWLFPEFMLLIAPPILLYMSAAVLFPRTSTGDDLDAHFFRRRQPFFLLTIATVVLFGLSHRFLEDGDLASVTNAFRLVLVCMCAGLIYTTHRGIHWTFALAILVTQFWWVYQYSFAI